MLLDRLLRHVNLQVAPFAVCDIRSGSRLKMEGARGAQMHFVLHGAGELAAKGGRVPLGRYSLVPIKAIASKVGYASRSHFSRAFKEQFARDPAYYRREHEDDQ